MKASASSRLRIKEGAWTNLSKLLGPGFTHGDLATLEAELGSKSERIMSDLGLRAQPIEFVRQGTQAHLKVNGIAGLLELGNLQWEILPKYFDMEMNADLWMDSILVLLGRAKRASFTYSRIRGLLERTENLVDHLALTYADALARGLRMEAIETYKVREQESVYLKGALLIERQLRKLPNNPHLLISQTSYLDVDNEFNHFMHWAGQQILPDVSDAYVMNELKEKLSRLPGAPSREWKPVRFPGRLPAQFRHYGWAMEIARIIARGFGTAFGLDRRTTYGFLFNMEDIFEEFLEASINLAVDSGMGSGFRNIPQSRLSYATPLTNNRQLKVIPDNVVVDGDTPILVVDAKYKLPKNESGHLPSTDFYQLLASLIGAGCHRGLLVHPSNPRFDRARMQVWRTDIGQDTFLLGSANLAMMKLTSEEGLQELDRSLTQIIEDFISIDGS